MKSKMARRLIAKCKWLSNVGEPPTLHRLRVMQKFQAASSCKQGSLRSEAEWRSQNKRS